jgi:hypothetical protein
MPTPGQHGWISKCSANYLKEIPFPIGKAHTHNGREGSNTNDGGFFLPPGGFLMYPSIPSTKTHFKGLPSIQGGVLRSSQRQTEVRPVVG